MAVLEEIAAIPGVGKRIDKYQDDAYSGIDRQESGMERFVDMHCHVLPEVDDGAQSLDETRKMLQTAYDEGIRYIIATPHYHPRRGCRPPHILRRQLRLVRREAERISDRLRIYLGNEIYFSQDIPDLLDEEEILTMNHTRYVLVEFSSTDSFERICQGIRQLQMRGYNVLLAHIERYLCMLEDTDRARYLAEMGVKIQVNADSITGECGRKVKKYVRQLMEQDLVFCTGTDAHRPAIRPPHMKKAAEYVARRYGIRYMRKIFCENAGIMLKKELRITNDNRDR